MLYGFNEGLKICIEEGLEERFSRHQKVSKYFDNIVKSTDFRFFVDKESESLPMLKSLVLPKNIKDDLRFEILKNDRIEIGGGLGHTKGLIWRVGFMGYNAEIKNVDIFFRVLNSYVWQNLNTNLDENNIYKILNKGFIKQNKSFVNTIGDDAAIWKFGKKQIAISCDSQIENIHFSQKFSNLYEICLLYTSDAADE